MASLESLPAEYGSLRYQAVLEPDEESAHRALLSADGARTGCKHGNTSSCWNIGVDRDEDSELIDDTKSKTGHSLYVQRASGTCQRERTEDCQPSRCSETRAAVISGRATSGPSSPDAHYSDTSRTVPSGRHSKLLRTVVWKEIRSGKSGSGAIGNRRAQRTAEAKELGAGMKDNHYYSPRATLSWLPMQSSRVFGGIFPLPFLLLDTSFVIPSARSIPWQSGACNEPPPRRLSPTISS